MATEPTPSTAWTTQQLIAIATGQRIAGEEPTAADLDAARRVLTGEATAGRVIADGLATLETEHGFTRQLPGKRLR
ncbi:hypothetical protein [Brevibacterium otitidis]|uniref:Antitoxin VbhA domain-containing protein n=1 Tax=Brevibacterium otitidis TaxID=53364 RepID=A0ABV5WXF8_9MICO|nr:hypothetical protein GCM10023233_32260 [Brevibacterium otitidis]